MNFEPGLIVVIAAIILFYLRIALLRGRKRRLAREAELEYKRARSKGKNVPRPAGMEGPLPTYEVASWWLLGAGGLLMLAGLALRTMPDLIPAQIQPYWWLATTVGVGVFAFGLK